MTDRIETTTDLRAPVERVWQALTDHTEFGAWFRVALEGPFVPGQPSRGHITYPGYEHLAWAAEVVAMERPRLFSFTWHPYAIDPGVDYTAEAPTLVTFHLETVATGTRLTIVEAGFEALPAHRRDEAYRMNERGWAMQVENLRSHLEA